MNYQRHSPGPDAARAFRLGMIAGGIAGLAGLGVLYWAGTLTLLTFGYSIVALFPIYLVSVSIVLSRWLGYDKDATNLRPVYQTK